MLTDRRSAGTEPLLLSKVGTMGRLFGDHREAAEGLAYRYRTGIPWRDLPGEAFGPQQIVLKRHEM